MIGSTDTGGPPGKNIIIEIWEFLILGRADVMVTGHHRHSLSGTTFGTSCNSWGCPDGFSTFVIQSQLYLFSIAILQSDNGILQEELCQRSDRLHFIPDTLLLVTSADAGWRRCSCPCCPEFTRRHRGSVTLVSDDDLTSIQLITFLVFECYFKSFQFLTLMFGLSQSELVSIDFNNSAKEFRERPSKVTTKQFKEVNFECFLFLLTQRYNIAINRLHPHNNWKVPTEDNKGYAGVFIVNNVLRLVLILDTKFSYYNKFAWLIVSKICFSRWNSSV